MGHFAKMCKTKSFRGQINTHNERMTKQKFSRKIRNIENENLSDDDDNIGCFKINHESLSDELISCFVGGHEIKMIIDSGSPVNLLTENHWHLLSSNSEVVWIIRTHTMNKFRAYAIKLKVFKIGLEACKIEMKQPFSKIANVKVKLSIDQRVKPVKQP